MLTSEIRSLLALAAQFDGRKVDDATTEAWRLVFELHVPDMTFAEAQVAVMAHYGDGSVWLMPNMVIERVRKRRAATHDNRTDRRDDVRSELGYRVVSEILARGRRAGSDPANGRRIGAARYEQIAEEVIVELGARQGVERMGQHCGWGPCTCTHTDGCEAGWVEVGDGSAVTACPYCSPTRAHILGSTHSTMDAGRTLRDTARTTR